MLASIYYGLTCTKRDDWFDAILNADTKLFVDPFLIFRESQGLWAGAHSTIIQHFDRIFVLIAESNFNRESIAYRKALDLLIFTEPKELCIGYTTGGTAGAGSGSGFARVIASAIEDAIQRGLEHPRHFEELGILNEGIGADRISDIACTILKPRLIQYTQEITRRHRMPLERHRVYASGFDAQRQRWETREHELLTNPFTKGPFMFVPQRFLRDLPVLNADDWWHNWENQQLRDDVNYEIMGKVDKATIVATARRHPEAVRQWTVEMEGAAVEPYDFLRDPKGVWRWDQATEAFAQENPLQLNPPQSLEEFLDVIEKVVGAFQLFVEDQKGWSLLWDTPLNKEKPEEAAQLLFRGIAASYCHANNISLDREVNLGRGPVDLKFSNGYRRRAHLEIKKVENSKFWNGLEQQLPTYMRSDEVSEGWFVAVRYRSGEKWDERVRELPGRVSSVAQERSIRLRFAIVDARPAESASRL